MTPSRPVPHLRTVLTLVLALLLVALTVVKIQLSEPRITPDTKGLLKVVENIQLHGCLSESEPASGECEPAWGSLPPGYPLFLAAVQALGGSLRVAVAAQVILFSVASWWLASSFPYGTRTELLARVVLLVASPLTMAWGRWLLTETLAMATTMAVFAVLLRALRDKRVSLPVLAGVLVAAMLIRWDQVWLAPTGVLLLGFLYPRREAFRRSLVLAGLVAIPFAALSVRALLQGLPAIPSQNVTIDLAPNLLRFWSSHALDHRATSGLVWPSWTRDYDRIRELNLGSISGAVPRTELAQVIDRLSGTDRELDFPPAVDQEFGRLATTAATEHPIRTWIGVPLTRIVRIWALPDRIHFSGWEGLEFPQRWEVWRSVYRVLLLLLAGLALLGKRDTDLRRAGALVWLYVLGRTGFLIWPGVNALETRYLVETFPVLEILAIWLVGSRIKDLLPGHAPRVSPVPAEEP